MANGAPPPLRSEAPIAKPYRSGLAAGIGIVLLAGLVLALADVVHTGEGAGPLLPLLGLWSILALPVALGVGLALGAGNAQWGAGFVRRLFRRLRDEPDLDRAIAGLLIAAALLGGVLVLGISKLAVGLVGDVQRKGVGGLLLGVVVLGVLPVLAIAALPIYRVARRIAAVIPAIGPLSRVVLLVIGAVVAMAAAGFYVVTTKLDYQALNLGSLVAPALLPVIATVIAIVAYGPLSRVRERIPARGAIAAGAAVVAAVLPFVGLRAPSDEVNAAVVDRSYVGGRMVAAIRKVWDRDHDGYSPFFGGPDCDDRDPNRHLRAMDGSCLDVDAVPDKVASTPADAAAPVAASPALTGGDNVLIIFIDTLRFDHLGIAGYQREGKSLTPRIDQFAQQSVVFRKAFAQAPNTPRSVPSFWTSQYPSQVKYEKWFSDYARLLDDNDTLFEALKPAGFKTIGETSHFFFCNRKRDPSSCANVVDATGAPMFTNIDQGADEWDNKDALPVYLPNGGDSNKDIAGPRIVKKTIAKLDELAQSKQKFAMLVHLFDPHSTYMVHNGFTYKEHGPAGLAEKYDYEIAFEDGLVGELFDELDKTGLAKTTTVVLMADHGEGFGFHTVAGKQDFFHGETIYQVVLHVPLIFRVPGGKPCMRDDVVELVDLAPTIAALFKVTPPKSWVGRSLVPALECKSLPAKPAFSQLMPAPSWNHEATSMISADGTRHILNRVSDSRWEFYDIDNDPDEKTNVKDSDPRVKQLEQQLGVWSDKNPAKPK